MLINRQRFKISKFFLGFIFASFVCTNGILAINPPFKLFYRKNSKTEESVKIVKSRFEVPQFIHTLNIDSICMSVAISEEIVPIYDNLKYTEFTELPDEYDLWSEDKIDPYNIKVSDIPDSVTIDVSGYIAPATGYVTSDFGLRKWRMHNGIDLKVNRGDTIRSAFDGTVRISRRMRGGYGIFVVIRHNNGLETLYGHLSKSLVNNNDVVKAGDVIGLGGSTGRSTGNHLHFEFRYLGNAINPNDIADFNTYCVKNSIFVLTSNNFEYKKELEKVRLWTVRSGDTLGRISMKTGVSISKLCQLNGIKRTTILRIGRKLRYT